MYVEGVVVSKSLVHTCKGFYCRILLLPVSIDMVVVLPAPLWPSRTVIWLLYMLRCMLFTATLLPRLNTWKTIFRSKIHEKVS